MQHSRQEMDLFFHVLAERYERGSLLITSHLVFSQWEKIFQDPTVTTTAVDRFVHHSVILELNLPNYRLEAAQQRQKAKQEPLETGSS